MASVIWDPDARKPADADEVEREIDKAVPSSQVKVTRFGDEWQVRALAPPGFCGRGRSLDDRDVSKQVAEILVDAGYPART